MADKFVDQSLRSAINHEFRGVKHLVNIEEILTLGVRMAKSTRIDLINFNVL